MSADIDIRKEKSEASTNDDLLQLVTFNISEEEYGIDITKVKEIIRMVDITRVPNTPDYVVGVINLRGKVIPIINLRNRMGMGKIEYTGETRIIVIELETMSVGFVVDGVNEVIRIHENITEKAPEMTDKSVDSNFITAVAKLEERLLILLDVEKILTREDLAEAKENADQAA